MQLQELVSAGLLVALAVSLYLAARYVRMRLGEAEFAQLMNTIAAYVEAAEQMARSGKLAKDGRFDWVAGEVAERFPQLSKAQIIAYVESAVYALNAGAHLLSRTVDKESD